MNCTFGKFARRCLAVALAFGFAATASAQVFTGRIDVAVEDSTGGRLPGVNVDLTGPVSQSHVTDAQGEAHFLNLPVGIYALKATLSGFNTFNNNSVQVATGAATPVAIKLGVAGTAETINVVAATPIIDVKRDTTTTNVTLEELQNIPSARDPWVILQQTAGIAMDRENIGGNMSGQQSNYVSRGGNPTNNKWSLDGVDITDMSATGSSPTYYDFDMFEEMTINTGGVDVTQQTGGVGINLVTKAGSDRFRGSSRYYRTNDNFESNNLTDDIRKQGASSGNPIQDIQDYGVEVGGPIKKGRAWIWGAFGKNVIDVGVLGFYQPTTACQQIKSDSASNPIAHPVDDVNGCLNTDETLLQTTNLKAEVQLFKGNKLSLYNLFSKKVRNARGASDLTPIESTTPQLAATSVYGQWGWRTGPTPTYKFGDQWVLSDRTLLDVQYAHIGNNFVLDYHDPSYATATPVAGVFGLQPTLITSTTLNGRSTPDGAQSVNIRPVNSITVNANYFLPGGPGGDHSFRIGGYWRDNDGYNSTHTPGNAVARFPTSAELANPNDCATQAIGCQMQLTRDGQTEYKLTNISLYGQDTITHGRATLQLGIRYDYNHDQALASSVTANPLRPDILPALTFAGADPGVKFNNFSPRLGFTYDLTGTGKTLAKVNYAMYWGQVGTGGISSQINPVTRVSVRYPWIDLNGDKFVQANELTILNGGRNFLAVVAGNWDANNPANVKSTNSVDPNLKNDRTDEFIVGLDREIGAGFAAGVNYIWRRYTNFTFDDTLGLSPSDYVAVNFTPAASTCPAAQNARCPQSVYYQPTFQLPTIQQRTFLGTDDYNRAFNGLEFTARKRMSHHWLMNTSASYNSTIVNNGFGGAFANTIGEDPTNLAARDGFQYDYASAGSGLGNIYVNAKWLFKVSGLYQLPYSVNVSAFYNARQGYPFEANVNSPSRANGAGIATVLLDGVGTNRLPTYQNLDFHIERPVKAGTVRFVPSMDVFNIGNANTVLALQRQQNSAIANNISQVLAPRVMRFGIRFNW
jgi:hypothetical protein